MYSHLFSATKWKKFSTNSYLSRTEWLTRLSRNGNFTGFCRTVMRWQTTVLVVIYSEFMATQLYPLTTICRVLHRRTVPYVDVHWRTWTYGDVRPCAYVDVRRCTQCERSLCRRMSMQNTADSNYINTNVYALLRCRALANYAISCWRIVKIIWALPGALFSLLLACVNILLPLEYKFGIVIFSTVLFRKLCTTCVRIIRMFNLVSLGEAADGR